MSKDLAILVIHGIGSQQPGFSRPTRDELEHRISGLGHDPDRIAWREIYWADILHPRQEQYLRDANAGNELDYVRLRRFVISALGDAAAYQQVGTAANNTYQLIHERIRLGMQDLSAAARSDRLQPVSSGNDAPVPLVIMAHSLGGHIVSNYIWDVQQRRRRGGTAGSDFEDFETLSGIVTFGCNVPLFTFAYSQVVPIEFPPASLPDDLRAKAKWLNFYDPDDVLGYPLKTLNAAYAAVVTEDLAINAGGLLSSWNPASHEGYWTDNDFTRPVAGFLAEFLRAGAGP